MIYEPKEKVKIANFGLGPGPYGYTYGTVIFKDDETDKLYWIQFKEGGTMRIHRDHLAKVSILEQLLYF